MARPGVEYESIERIARQLLSQGQHPSVQKVRDILGTGSNTTIAKHLKTWQTSFDVSRTPHLPESVPEDLMNPLDDFWALAVAKAESKYQKYKTELEAQIETANASEQLAFNQLAEKDKQVKKLSAKVESIENTHHETERELLGLRGEYKIVSSELVHAHTELERTHALLLNQENGFKSEREKLSTDHAQALQYERERTKAAENKWLQEVDQLRQTTKSLESDLVKQQKTYHLLQEKSQQHELSSQQKMTELTAQSEQLAQALQQKEVELLELRDQCQSIKLENTQSTTAISKQFTAVQEQLSQSLETVEALRQSLEQSKQNEMQLSIENAQLKVLNK